MFLAVIMGYIVAALFSFCGIANAVYFLQTIYPEMGYEAFLSGLAFALWPLAVGTASFLLVQIAILIEKQCILTEARQNAATPSSFTPKPPQSPAPLPKKAGDQVRTEKAASESGKEGKKPQDDLSFFRVG